MLKVFYELKYAGNLPSPAGVGMQILRLTQEPDCGLDEITKVIRSDPALTGRVLKVATSVAHGAGGHAPPLEEAVLRVGFGTLRSLVLGFSLVSSNPRLVCRAFDYNAFWHRSLGRAVASQYLAERSGLGIASESYICGLLAEIGRLGLACAHPDRYADLLESAGCSELEQLIAVESREFGINHRELTEAMLVDWGFFASLARAAAMYRHIESQARDAMPFPTLRRTIRLAEVTACALETGFPGPAEFTEEQRAEFESFGIDESELGESMLSIQRSWREWGVLLQVPAPGTIHRRETAATGGSPAPRIPPAGERGISFMTSPTAAERAVTPPDGANGSMPTPGPGHSVLLFEPDDAMADMFVRTLRAGGYEPLRTRSVREAVSLSVVYAPPIAIAHGGSDNRESLELCRILRSFEAGRNMFFILVTTDRSPDRLLADIDRGVDDHLVLPFDDGACRVRLRAAARFVETRARLVEQEKALQQHLADLAVANRKLHRTAMTDELTQLPNRRYADEAMREAWNAACLTNDHLSLIVADIDHFKRVNDRYGHAAGDAVLSTIARLLRRELRATDIACRLGGEEFLVICPNTDIHGARICAERLRQKVAATEIPVNGGWVRVTISLGVASRVRGESSASSIESLMKAADDASAVSKRSGRNLVSDREAD